MYPFEKEEAVRSTKIECISFCQVSPHSGVEAKRNEKRMVILMILFVPPIWNLTTIGPLDNSWMDMKNCVEVSEGETSRKGNRGIVQETQPLSPSKYYVQVGVVIN